MFFKAIHQGGPSPDAQRVALYLLGNREWGEKPLQYCIDNREKFLAYVSRLYNVNSDIVQEISALLDEAHKKYNSKSHSTPRQLLQLSIKELEAYYNVNVNNSEALKTLIHELGHRKVSAAANLKAKAEASLSMAAHLGLSSTTLPVKEPSSTSVSSTACSPPKFEKIASPHAQEQSKITAACPPVTPEETTRGKGLPQKCNNTLGDNEGTMNCNAPTKSTISVQKISRLVEYLQRLASLRSKLIRDIAEYEKVLWISAVPHERECFAQAWGRDEEHEPDVWVEVDYRREPELPAVPVLCKDWVNHTTLRVKDDLPTLLPTITPQTKNVTLSEESGHKESPHQTLHLDDHPEIQRAWGRYVKDKWHPWRESHNSWEKIHKVYSLLFAIHQEQLRLGEEYELVLGLGLLTWQTPNGQRVRRHLVVADATLEFESRLGRFTVRPHGDGPKLRPELDMLDIEEQPARAEEMAKAALASAADDPWEKAIVEGVFEALVHSIHSQGDYDGSIGTGSLRVSSRPIVEYAPALILRKRSAKGLTETLKRIKEQVEGGADVPEEFADLAEVRTHNEHDQADGLGISNAEFEGEIFFPKPSNDEQRRIVDKIRVSNGVLVQGPPGTGKSHTIANLICHLLATGQRTLITAKTPRALQVLEKLVPHELRPLCINLLGSGLDERRSLESSVGGILRKNVEWNEERSTRETLELVRNLRKLREEKTVVDRRLRDIRESETYSQSIAGGAYKGTAAHIAKAVSRDQVAYEWFTDSVPFEQACQVSKDDIRRILEALRSVSGEKRKELDLFCPDVLLPLEEFSELVMREKQSVKELAASGECADCRLADLLTNSEPSVIKAICDTLLTYRDSRKIIKAMPHPWIGSAMIDIMCGNASYWHELLRVTRDTIESVETHAALADASKVDFPNTCDVRVLCEDARKLKEHMDSGGALGWGIFRPKAIMDKRYLIKSVKVNGRPCTSGEHFATLANALHVRIECEKAWGFWRGRSDEVVGSYALQLASLKSLLHTLESVLSIELQICKCREVIHLVKGIDEPVWSDEHQIEQIIASCTLALASIRKRLATETIQKVETSIASIATKNNAHPAAKALLVAVRERELDSYAQSVNTIQDLYDLRQRFQRAKDCFNELRGIVPLLAETLVATYNERYWDARVQDFEKAWHWAQARYWIENHI